MVSWRSPELEGLVGGLLDGTGLTEAALQSLVDGGAREGEQLEFKSEPYPSLPAAARPAWTPAQEFAKDVSALANLRGGLLLLGVLEDDGAATGLSAAAGDVGGTEKRLRQALYNQSAPVPRVDFVPVPVPAAAGGGYLAVVVPPSPSAPHAVLTQPGENRRALLYPVRDGADTRWMSEGEVAGRYRRRSEQAVDRALRARQAVDEGLDALRRATGLWLWVAVVPHSPAPRVLDRAAVRDAEGWWRSYRFLTPNQRELSAMGSAIPAPGRVTVTEPAHREDQEATDPRRAYLELHVDGTAFAATTVAQNTQRDADGSQVGDVTLAEDTLLGVDAALSWTIRQAGAWGGADLMIGLTDAGAEPGLLTRPVVLVGVRQHGLQRIGDRRALVAPEAATVADLAGAVDQQGRLVVTHDALAALLHHFGFAAPVQLAGDGTVVTGTWNTDPREVARWADEHRVPHRPLPEP